MSCVGIIAEYNPFHNGHAYQLKKARELSGCTNTAVVMSGDFVQRGEPAMLDKFLRTRFALTLGADIVFMLPAAYSLTSARLFARAAVFILKSSGIVTHISFGSESCDMRLLESCAQADESDDEFSVCIRNLLDAGLPYPAAYSNALMRYTGSDRLLGANDMLAVEYIRAIRDIAPDLIAVPVKREGMPHDSNLFTDESYASASAIRERILLGSIDEAPRYTPKPVSDYLRSEQASLSFRTYDNLSDVLVYALRSMSVDALRELAEVSEGLENRIYRACRDNTSILSVLESIKTKRYTMARLKRITLCAALGITSEFYSNMDCSLYLRVLGVRRSSSALLSSLENSSIPVIAKFSDVKCLSPKANLVHSADMKACELAVMASRTPECARFDYSSPLIIE